MADYLQVFEGEKWLDFGYGAELENTVFLLCINLLVKLKGSVKYHAKNFDMGFENVGDAAEVVRNPFGGVRGANCMCELGCWWKKKKTGDQSELIKAERSHHNTLQIPNIHKQRPFWRRKGCYTLCKSVCFALFMHMSAAAPSTTIIYMSGWNYQITILMQR